MGGAGDNGAGVRPSTPAPLTQGSELTLGTPVARQHPLHTTDHMYLLLVQEMSQATNRNEGGRGGGWQLGRARSLRDN